LLGATPANGDRIVMLDDVLTTSATKVEAVQALAAFAQQRQIELHWGGVVVGVDRQGRQPDGSTWAEGFGRSTGIPVFALTRLSFLLDVAEARGIDVSACRAYLA
jgi:orotate phosphoribosyltransferase